MNNIIDNERAAPTAQCQKEHYFSYDQGLHRQGRTTNPERGFAGILVRWHVLPMLDGVRRVESLRGTGDGVLLE